MASERRSSHRRWTRHQASILVTGTTPTRLQRRGGDTPNDGHRYTEETPVVAHWEHECDTLLTPLADTDTSSGRVSGSQHRRRVDTEINPPRTITVIDCETRGADTGHCHPSSNEASTLQVTIIDHWPQRDRHCYTVSDRPILPVL